MNKLLSVAIPCFNSEAYMEHAVDSLLTGGDRVEILIVDDGSTDGTGRIAEEYERLHPGTVRAIRQENAGHGGAVMTGLRNASGLYFKVVDSDDRVDPAALRRVLDALEKTADAPVDMCIGNYVYDKAGARHKHAVRYRHALPEGRVFGWEEVGRFKKGQYLLMHALIYRTALLRDCGLRLPLHTFYVDMLYAYQPLTMVKRMLYLDVDLYLYFIGREDQSVQEQVMLRRVDQYLEVNRRMFLSADPFRETDKRKQAYMLNFLEIVTTVSSVLLTKKGTKEALQKKEELWSFIERENPQAYRVLRRRAMGFVVNLPGRAGREAVSCGYRISRRIFGFN